MPPKILIVFHSISGNVFRLAKAVEEGAKEEGAEVSVKRVEETVPENVLKKNPGHMLVRDEMYSSEYAVATVDELPEYDAIIFGSPTRFGNMSAQMKNFLDRTGRHWVTMALSGKVGAVFQSNEMPHGGKEATLLSMILPLYAHGMIVVGLPPVKELYRAGSYYGATATGNPGEYDLRVGKILGRRVARVAKRMEGYNDSDL